MKRVNDVDEKKEGEGCERRVYFCLSPPFSLLYILLKCNFGISTLAAVAAVAVVVAASHSKGRSELIRAAGASAQNRRMRRRIKLSSTIFNHETCDFGLPRA